MVAPVLSVTKSYGIVAVATAVSAAACSFLMFLAFHKAASHGVAKLPCWICFPSWQRCTLYLAPFWITPWRRLP